MKLLSIGLNVLAACLFAWCLYPIFYPIFLVIAVATPWIVLALLAVTRGHLQLAQETDGYGDARPDTTALMLAPAISLAIVAFRFDGRLVDATEPLIWVVAVAIILALLAWGVRRPHPGSIVDRNWAAPLGEARPSKAGFFLAALFFAVAYSYSAAALINMSTDTGQAQTHAVTITSRHAESGRSQRYFLKVEPWAMQRDGGEHQVSFKMYHDLRSGQPICFDVSPGRFGWAWRSLRRCS